MKLMNLFGVDVMRLNHNLATLNIYRNQLKVADSQSKALNNITTGYKINSAKDNPNAIAQSERMRIQIRGIQMASRNVQDGMSMLQTADGALDSISTALRRMKELTIQAGSASSTDDRQVIQNEIDQMKDLINQTSQNNEYNGVKLLNDNNVTSNDSPESINMITGANVGESIAIPKYNISTALLGSNKTTDKLSNISVLNDVGISNAIDTINGSLETVNSIRSKYGALENRFEGLYQNLDSISVSLQGAESGLRDADLASEMIDYSKAGILIDAGNAMMVQSNNFPKDILRVLENVK